MTETETIHPELGREVPIGSIDKELRKLWAEDQARTNASLINLAVCSEKPDGLVENSALMRELTREHACRALLIGIDREAAETSIRAWITAHCHLSHGHKSVCCEQLSFALTGRATGRLRNTVFAHLNSDLPLILWWQGELSPIFEERLYSLLDRFVFDSSEWVADPAASFRRLGEALENSDALVIQDLEWTRSFQMRVSIAALFDEPQAQAMLDGVEAVEIRHHPRHRNAALQLLAWIAVQAGWGEGSELALGDERRNGGRQSFSFEQAGGSALTATLIADEGAAPLEAVAIRGGEACVEVRMAEDREHLVRRFECPGHRTESISPADRGSAPALLGEQLSRGGRNSLFRKVLPRFLQLLGS